MIGGWLPEIGDVVEEVVIESISFGLRQYRRRTIRHVEFLWPSQIVGNSNVRCECCGSDLRDRLNGPPQPWVMYFEEGSCTSVFGSLWRWPVAEGDAS